jgi:uncharacterized membrane protein YjgN (DUF898 family)
VNTARALDPSTSMSCARCSTSHRVRDIYALKSGMKASCSNCAASFVVVSMPDASLDDAAPSGVFDEIPEQDQEPVEEEVVQAEEIQRRGSIVQRAAFHGTGRTLFGIHLVNTLLTLVTLGFYYYWAKVRVRTFLFSQTEFAGDRFSYHGSARELLNGTMKASLIFGIPYFLLKNVGHFLEENMAILLTSQAAASLLLIFFIPFAVVSARRYRLSRTAWRGIRFSFRGKTLDFIKLWLFGYFLTAVTLGLYYPYFSTKRHSYLTEHSYFGCKPFKFSGDGAALSRPFLMMYVPVATAAIVAGLGLYSFVELPQQNMADPETMGPFIFGAIVGLIIVVLAFRLLWLPYSVIEQRFFWEQTSIGSARFRLPITIWPYLKLKLCNLFIMLCTIGLAWPWVTIRNIRFITDQLALVGKDNFDETVQAYDGAPPTGEGLDGFLDTGFDLG